MSSVVVQLQPCYVLHTRAYRDTSLLVEALTRDHGRVSLVARGVRSAKSKQRGLLQAFSPLLISWTGKGDLHALTQVENNGAVSLLAGERLFSALYINELLMRLLHRYDPCPSIYDAYAELVEALAVTVNEQKILRIFEKKLLAELGYAFSFDEIEANDFYLFDHAHGFTKIQHEAAGCFLGKNLLAFSQEDFTQEETLVTAKRLMRLAFAPLLGVKPLKSRELFVKK